MNGKPEPKDHYAEERTVVSQKLWVLTQDVEKICIILLYQIHLYCSSTQRMKSTSWVFFDSFFSYL